LGVGPTLADDGFAHEVDDRVDAAETLRGRVFQGHNVKFGAEFRRRLDHVAGHDADRVLAGAELAHHRGAHEARRSCHEYTHEYLPR
jgi:hypothetical protein